MEQFFEYLLRPPNEAAFSISLAFCAAINGWHDFDSYNPRTFSGNPGGVQYFPETQIWHVMDFLMYMKMSIGKKL